MATATPIKLAPIQVVPSLPKIGARLQKFFSQWRKLGGNRWAVSVAQRGLMWEFHTPPPLRVDPWYFNLPLSQEKAELLHLEIMALLEKGAIELVTPPMQPGFYVNLFLVTKASGGFRPVMDLSALNKYIICPKFKMESPRSITRALVKGQWAASLDLKDAYLHVPVNKQYRKYLRFAYRNQIYQCRALPFGLNIAPLVFTKLMQIPVGYAHRMGVKVHTFLDDWLILAESPEKLLIDLQFMMNTLDSLGLVINIQKSELVPTQDIVYLGIRLRLDLGLMFPSPGRIQKILLVLQKFVQLRSATPRHISSILGLLASISDQVPLNRLSLRPPQYWFLSQWNHSPETLDVLIPLPKTLRRYLARWLHTVNYHKGVPFYPPPPQMTLVTDASLTGWGGHMEVDKQFLMISGIWSREERKMHINLLELLAIKNCLLFWENLVRNKSLLILTDNTTVIAYIKNQGGTHSTTLTLNVKTLLIWADNRNVVLTMRHIPGSRNVLADSLSRRYSIPKSEWMLHKEVTRELFSIWGLPLLDLFATRKNCQLASYVSPYPDSQASATDGLSVSWKLGLNYAYPPTPLIQLVLAKLQREGGELILIAPYWQNHAWFPLLLSLVSDTPRQLPQWKRLLTQGRVEGQNLGLMNLFPWRLSGKISQTRAFLSRLPISWHKGGDSLPSPTMPLDGQSFLLGVLEKRWILSLPLFQ